MLVVSFRHRNPKNAKVMIGKDVKRRPTVESSYI